MGAYPTGGSMKDLLVAMRDKALQDTTKLKYLDTAEVRYPPLRRITSAPAVFLVPLDSIEEKIGESGAQKVMTAVHRVAVFCALYVATHDDTAAILGSGTRVGIVEHVDNVIDFYAGNLLSLAGLEPQNKPDIEAGSGAYGIEQTDDDEFLILAELEYKAFTKPFTRG